MINVADTPQNANGFLVSAPWRSSGKTVISIGLAAMINDQLSLNHVHGKVQTFKKGPDYIDPLWLSAASGTPCYNLDFRQQSRDEILRTYRQQTAYQNPVLVEGTMGLHDGVAEDGSDSNAAMAVLLGLPVVLVVDCRGMHRSVAALINGIQNFDRRLSFGGVVLNRVRSSRHQEKIEKALSAYTDMPVLGALPDSEALNIAERELGLLPVSDCFEFKQRIDAIAREVQCNLDVSDLVSHSNRYTESVPFANSATSVSSYPSRLKIGIARDEAFHFYYQDDIDMFLSKGVELIECSPCTGELPASLDGFWIGGGFPERHVKSLVDNVGFREALKAEIEHGLPVHAECAGLMYLCNEIELDEQCLPMVGVIDATVSMRKKPQGRGYMNLSVCEDPENSFPAHEFHHSTLEFHSPPEFVYQVRRGHGIDGSHDGVRYHNVIASYAHFRHTKKMPWIDQFLKRIEARKQNRVANYV